MNSPEMERKPDADREWQKTLASLETLRDEIRVRLHLAGMDAKDAWAQLEPRMADAERLARDASASSRDALLELVRKAEDLLGKLNPPKA